MRVRVGEFDVRDPRPVWGLLGYDSAQVLVRNGAQPVGWVKISADSRDVLDEDVLRQAIRDQLGEIPERDLAEPSELPPISVVVCTRDRPVALRGCLESLARLRYPAFEVIVVDNASKGPETRELVRAAGFFYEREERPGLDPARNCGWKAAHAGIVAYTDDDARVDPEWLMGIARGFADPSISCVTGLICPLELESPAQTLFELYGGMGKGFRPRVFSPASMRPEAILAAHSVGVGANMAYRRDVLARLGGFDPHLDVGTPSNGAGDLDMFHRLLASGGQARYEPSALAWHQHRRLMPGLYRQICNNGRSFGCYLMKAAVTRSIPRTALARFAVRDWIGGWLLGSLLSRRKLRGLILAESWGVLQAPYAYLKTYGKI